MAHVRQQIRDAFKTAFAGIAGVQKVVGIRTHPFNPAELPAIQVITASEDIRPFDHDEIETMRTVNVEVSVWGQGDDGIDDTLDTVSAEIENRILSAAGAFWENGIILKFPSSASITLGELASEKTAVVLTTRFSVSIQATDPSTIGD